METHELKPFAEWIAQPHIYGLFILYALVVVVGIRKIVRQSGVRRGEPEPKVLVVRRGEAPVTLDPRRKEELRQIRQLEDGRVVEKIGRVWFPVTDPRD